jgi:hypothetical protein
MPKKCERDLRTILMYLPQKRAAELAIRLGGDPLQPFNPDRYPDWTTVSHALAMLEDDELWHLAMAWCHRRGDPPLSRGPEHRSLLLSLLTRACERVEMGPSGPGRIETNPQRAHPADDAPHRYEPPHRAH